MYKFHVSNNANTKPVDSVLIRGHVRPFTSDT